MTMQKEETGANVAALGAYFSTTQLVIWNRDVTITLSLIVAGGIA